MREAAVIESRLTEDGVEHTTLQGDVKVSVDALAADLMAAEADIATLQSDVVTLGSDLDAVELVAANAATDIADHVASNAAHSHTDLTDVGSMSHDDLESAISANAAGIATNASDLSNHAAATTTHGVAGTLMGTSDAQTVTNKDLSSNTNNVLAAAGRYSGIVRGEYRLTGASNIGGLFDNGASVDWNGLPFVVRETSRLYKITVAAKKTGSTGSATGTITVEHNSGAVVLATATFTFGEGSFTSTVSTVAAGANVASGDQLGFWWNCASNVTDPQIVVTMELVTR